MNKIAAGIFGAGALGAGAYYMLRPAETNKMLIISGAPASGKGTQCKFLVEKFNVKHISTGDALRSQVKAKTEIGNKAKGFMTRGELVPDSVIADVMAAETKEGCDGGWLLDGVPRTAAQVVALNESGLIPEKVIFLNVPDDVLELRVCGRLFDPETGDTYHKTYGPPTDPVVAARCVTRPDDTKEALKKRLVMFYENREAIKAGYPGKIIEIDGNQSKPDVFKAICDAL